MFTVEYRDRVRDRVLALAHADVRVTAGAMVGSLALGSGDRWSDLDLTFGVLEEVSLIDILNDWSGILAEEFEAVQLFDLPHGPSIYRVFLLPGLLQFDLSFTPASRFGATGPKFRLLFGNAVERPFNPIPPARELFGYAVHHALRARFCIERGRPWQAQYWISHLRDYAMSLACRARQLPAAEARGADQLPAEVLEAFKPTLVTSLDTEELLRALECAIEALLKESSEVQDMAARLEPQLRELTQPWEP